MEPILDNWGEKDVIPHSVRREGLESVVEFLRLRNVSHIWTHRKSWKKFFEVYPDTFKPLSQAGPFYLFEFLETPGSYFLEGSGEILSQTTGGIRLVPQSKELVLSFTYYPWLELSSCELAAETVGEGKFIKLLNCVPGELVSIHSPGFLSRLSSAI